MTHSKGRIEFYIKNMLSLALAFFSIRATTHLLFYFTSLHYGEIVTFMSGRYTFLGSLTLIRFTLYSHSIATSTTSYQRDIVSVIITRAVFPYDLNLFSKLFSHMCVCVTYFSIIENYIFGNNIVRNKISIRRLLHRTHTHRLCNSPSNVYSYNNIFECDF